MEAEIEGEVALTFMVGYHAVTDVGLKVNLDLAVKLPDPRQLLQCFETKPEQQKAQDMAAARKELEEKLETEDCFETEVTPEMMKEISGGLTENEFKQKTSQERDSTSLGSYTLFSTFPTEMGEVSKVKVKATFKCISAAFSFVKACAKQTKDAVVGVFSGESEAFKHEITGDTALERIFMKSLDSFDAAKKKFDGIITEEEKLQKEHKGPCVRKSQTDHLKAAIANSVKSVEAMRGVVAKAKVADDKPAAAKPAAKKGTVAKTKEGATVAKKAGGAKKMFHQKLLQQDAEGLFDDVFVTLQWSFTSVEFFIEKNFKDLAELEWTRSSSGGKVTTKRSVSVVGKNVHDREATKTKGEAKPTAKPAAAAKNAAAATKTAAASAKRAAAAAAKKVAAAKKAAAAAKKTANAEKKKGFGLQL